MPAVPFGSCRLFLCMPVPQMMQQRTDFLRGVHRRGRKPYRAVRRAERFMRKRRALQSRTQTESRCRKPCGGFIRLLIRQRKRNDRCIFRAG